MDALLFVPNLFLQKSHSKRDLVRLLALDYANNKKTIYQKTRRFSLRPTITAVLTVLAKKDFFGMIRMVWTEKQSEQFLYSKHSFGGRDGWQYSEVGKLGNRNNPKLGGLVSGSVGLVVC